MKKKNLDLNYMLILPGLISKFQPLDIGVNKIFKEKLKFKFEHYKIDRVNNNEKLSLQNAIIRLLTFINDIWFNDEEIQPNAIINSFNKSWITTTNYIAKREEKVISNCINDLLIYEYNYITNTKIKKIINNISLSDLSNNNIIKDDIVEEYGIDIKEYNLNKIEDEENDNAIFDIENVEEEGKKIL